MKRKNDPQYSYRPITTKRCVGIVKLFCILVIFVPITSGQQPEARVVELAPCSVLNLKIYQRPSNRIESPYMSRMREMGVARASIQIQGEYRKGKAKNLRSTRHVYFNKFDGPDSQISDDATLSAIKNSGLQETLDKIAIEKASKAKIALGIEKHPAPPHQLSTDVQIFSTESIGYEPLLGPYSQLPPLVAAVQAGDASEVQTLTNGSHFSQVELDQALFRAVTSDFDNSTCIHLLVRAGANVNGHTSDGVTPLMTAVSRPCSIKPLLEGGARLDARDRWGRTALQIARQQKVEISVHMLETAGTN